MKGVLTFLGIIALIAYINTGNNGSGKKQDTSKAEVATVSTGSPVSSYTSNYNSNSIASSTPQVQSNPYADNYLSTGSVPYSNRSLSGTGSEIKVKSSTNGEDMVVIVKNNGSIVRNAYIRKGGSHTFYVPNGRYQVFFYSGKGWNPNKQMPGGMRGGFVERESFAKDYAMNLDYESVTYDLVPQYNGNFSTASSSATEMF